MFQSFGMSALGHDYQSWVVTAVCRMASISRLSLVLFCFPYRTCYIYFCQTGALSAAGLWIVLADNFQKRFCDSRLCFDTRFYGFRPRVVHRGTESASQKKGSEVMSRYDTTSTLQFLGPKRFWPIELPHARNCRLMK